MYNQGFLIVIFNNKIARGNFKVKIYIKYFNKILNFIYGKGVSMGSCNFEVRLSPREAFDIIQDRVNADLVYSEFNSLDHEKATGVLIFEKYFFRVSNRVALVVLIDNLKGDTVVKSISTGSSEGLFLKFDWGASEDFAYSVKDIMEKYII